MRSLFVASVAAVVAAIPLAGGATLSTPSVETSGSVVVLGNFTCYSARFSEFATRKVQLTDQFGKRTTALVARPDILCSPASVNGWASNADRRAHLTCHPVQAAPTTRIGISVTNQFGAPTMTVLVRSRLCVPSSAATGGALSPPSTKLDNFTCYSIGPGEPFKQRLAVVADQFVTTETKDFVIAPNSVCAPATVDTSRPRKSRLLMCYEIRSVAKARSVVVRSKFALLKASLGTRGQICVPSVRVPVQESRIAFESNRSGLYQVYVMNPDGTAQKRLTGESQNFDPAWSPGGEQLAFESDRDNKKTSDIYKMNADGTRQTRLTTSRAPDRNPAWSPNGTKIAFQSNRTGNYEIYVMNTNGTAQTNLTNRPGDDSDPVWSPDGSKIAFDSNRDGNYEIYVMNADGTHQIRLTRNPARDLNPTWSPDGTKIAFESDRSGNDEIYVMNAATGSRQTNLTSNAARDSDPTWSPLGRIIAFASDRDGNTEIYVMNADGSKQTRLTTDPAVDLVPNFWQRRR